MVGEVAGDDSEDRDAPQGIDEFEIPALHGLPATPVGELAAMV